VSEARGLLDSGRPVTLDIDFYYGAWNHRKATEYGISRDQSQWEAGIVGYPESDTIDEQQSRIHRAGHSIVIVGYDDSVEVTTQIAMTDGSTKTFTRKGVYYFKNSWGTEKFGVKFSVEGKNFPGYGMITQDYAHDYGQFYKFGWKN
jgi:C1A family cysteine protease